MFYQGVANSGSELRRIAIRLALVLAAAGLLTAATAPGFIPRYYFLHEDSPVLGVLIVLLFATAVDRRSNSTPSTRYAVSRRTVLIGATLVALLLWAATYFLFKNYPLSRDEQMVIFDMQVFRHFRLAAPVPPEWRQYAQALTPAFLLPLPGNAAWVSSYMPGNAMLRTLFGSVLDPALMNPALAAVGAVATFDCARRLFPDDHGAPAVALLMYATSAQVLVAAMTPFAMTAHVALNMIWLSLYLRGTRAGHAGAIALGFVAIGLHQIIFHPLFALPFIDHLRRCGKWRAALTYVVSYALFGLFWISYPHLVAISAGLQPAAGPGAGVSGFVATRVLPLLSNREAQTFPLMEANLLRFIAWQNLALVPLVILGFRAIRRSDGIAAPLAAGVALTVVAMAVLLPYQAIGWGYRYLHGLIGNCALLAAYGWRDHSDRPVVRAFVRRATLGTIAVTIPFLMWQAAAFVRPYARVNHMIGNINADMVVISTYGTAFRIDEVRNLPDLSNRPIRLAGNVLSPADIPILCARGTIAFVDVVQMQSLGVGFGDQPDQTHFQQLQKAASNSCSKTPSRSIEARK